MMIRSTVIGAFFALPVSAETFLIKEISYAEIEEFVSEVIDFETQAAPESGLLRLEAVSFGQRFSGQTLMHRQDDMLDWHFVLEDPTPRPPLTLLSAGSHSGLAIRNDYHWGSRALHPLGPTIGPRPERNLGNGTLAMQFEPPVCFLAFRTAIDGMSRFGNVNNTILRGKPEGSLNIRFYDEQGQELASFMRSYNPEGPIEIGYIQSGQAEPHIAGVLLQGLDLEGFGIDDVRFDPDCPLKLF